MCFSVESFACSNIGFWLRTIYFYLTCVRIYAGECPCKRQGGFFCNEFGGPPSMLPRSSSSFPITLFCWSIQVCLVALFKTDFLAFHSQKPLKVCLDIILSTIPWHLKSTCYVCEQPSGTWWNGSESNLWIFLSWWHFFFLLVEPRYDVGHWIYDMDLCRRNGCITTVHMACAVIG